MNNTGWAFAQYENIRNRLPKAKAQGSRVRVDHLGELADDFDVFLFDAFGVLNIGFSPVPGAAARVDMLQALGKRTIVLTNGASYPGHVARAKYKRYGYNFAAEDIISSRDALAAHLRSMPALRWGAMAPKGASFDGLDAEITLLEDDPDSFAKAEGFLLIGSEIWNDALQAQLVESLRQNPRPVLVGNPDIVAGYEHGFVRQPGLYAHWLANETAIEPQFFGKPFAEVFAEAARRFGPVPPERVLMIGDTLHTDILGGAAAGFKTLLVEDHGMFKGEDVRPYMDESGIFPDFITPTI